MVALDTADIDGNVYLVLADIRGITELTDGSGRLSVTAMIQAVSSINGSYNDLANIPVITQDLSASGFTPVANTYYRHTGATTDAFTQGVIYLYDTAYHKLGESGGGGTTLNRYEVTTGSGALLYSIINTAKSVNVCTLDVNGYKIIMFKEDSSDCCGYYYSSKTIDNSIHIIKYIIRLYTTGTRNIFAIDLTTGKRLQDVSGLSVGDCYILYYNDTEIT